MPPQPASHFNHVMASLHCSLEVLRARDAHRTPYFGARNMLLAPRKRDDRTPVAAPGGGPWCASTGRPGDVHK